MPELLNSAENKTQYLTSRAKSLNLGIYITDMAYSATFERTNEAVDYLDAVKFLSQELNISTSIFESLIERSKKTIGQKDSILLISNEVFFEMLGFLEDGGKMNTVAMISSGAFLESIYLALESVNDYEKDILIIRQIEELRYPLQNLLAQSKYSESDPNVKNMLVFLNELNEIFLELNPSGTEPTFTKNAKGELTILGGTAYTITEKDYIAMKAKVNEIRTTIISY